MKELSAEQRRIAVDAVQLYQHFLDLRQGHREFRGGLHWKTVGAKQYLIRTLDRMGHQRSLGPRSPKTEELFHQFREKKNELRGQLKSIEEELSRLAKFCVAAGVNRVPRIAADIVRLLDSSGLLGTHLLILGSHAIYAYELAAGVQLKAGLLQTNDLDTLLDSKAELEIAGGGPNRRTVGSNSKSQQKFQACQAAVVSGRERQGFYG